jgi:cytochrome c peroxidase
MIFNIHNNLLFLAVTCSTSVFSADFTKEERLGRQLYSDINLSIQRNQSCESCHSLSKLKVPTETKSGLFQIKKQPALGFVDPEHV